MYRLELELTGLPKRINEWSGSSWHSKYRESQKWLKRLMGKMLVNRQSPPPRPLNKAKITLTRYSSRSPDYDGLVISFKPLIDALKNHLIISDDSMKVIGKPVYEWVQVRPREGRIKIVVEEEDVTEPK